MRHTKELSSGGYYLFESLASSRSSYFESEEEIRYFKVLIKRYLLDYIDVQKLYVSKEGYQLLVKLRTTKTIIKRYRCKMLKKGKNIRKEYEEEPWRIISEQVRIFHSVYAKYVNRNRGRKGVLVQMCYSRYYYVEISELESYKKRMDKGEEIVGQKNVRYRVKKQWSRGVNWVFFRGKEFVESLCFKTLQDHVVETLIKSTYTFHNPPP